VAQAAERTSAALPAQAQVAAWVRTARAEAMGRAGLLPVFGPRVKNEPVLHFSFSWKIEKGNWIKKKIKKVNFSLGVKFKKLGKSFSAAKEKVYSPVILNRRVI